MRPADPLATTPQQHPQMSKPTNQKEPQKAGRMRRLVLLFCPRVRIVTTHTPGEWCKPGTEYQWRAGLPWYLITEVRRVVPTALAKGGAAGCFEVWGVEIRKQNV